MKQLNAALGLLPLLIAVNTFAEDEAKKAWAVSAELGAIQTTGNTNTATVKAKIDASYSTEKWVNKLLFDALYKEDEITDASTSEKHKEKTAEKYFASYQLDYLLHGGESYLYGLGSYTDDKFGGVAENKTVSAGYGILLIDGTSVKLDADIGPGYTWISKQTGEKSESTILHVAASLLWNVTDTSEFTLKASVEPSFEGEKSVRSKGGLGFATKIHDDLQMKLSYNLENNSKVDESEFKKLDTETAITLVYSF